MKAKIISLIAAVCTAVMLPTAASAAANGTCGDNLTWTLSDAGVLTISGTGAMTTYTKTSTADFRAYVSDIKEVVIGEGVTTVGAYAFYNCTALTSVELPDGLEKINDWAFNTCSALTEITFPDSLTTIAAQSFQGTGLIEITVPEGVTTLGTYCFQGCQSLKEVYLPDTLTSLGQMPFYGCGAIEYLKIPDSVTTGTMQLMQITNLKVLEMPKGATTLFSTQQDFYLKRVEIPKTVKTIPSGAFVTNQQLEIYYEGTEEEWANITINDAKAKNATVYYQSSIANEHFVVQYGDTRTLVYADDNKATGVIGTITNKSSTAQTVGELEWEINSPENDATRFFTVELPSEVTVEGGASVVVGVVIDKLNDTTTYADMSI